MIPWNIGMTHQRPISAKYFSFPSAPQRQDIELLDIN